MAPFTAKLGGVAVSGRFDADPGASIVCQGSVDVPPGSEIEPGRAYRLDLDDGRSFEVRVAAAGAGRLTFYSLGRPAQR